MGQTRRRMPYVSKSLDVIFRISANFILQYNHGPCVEPTFYYRATLPANDPTPKRQHVSQHVGPHINVPATTSLTQATFPMPWDVRKDE
mmetsp:Transcript_38757/g.90094  ORF Transcript_38757/g.90094 Transcript_38757/m.90094 type:complete len:89 (-) Transcript_38757:121-387(-)